MRGSSKKKPKAEESGLRKGLTPYPVGERNGDKGKQFPTALKIRLATSSAFWARRRGYAAITCWRLSRKRYNPVASGSRPRSRQACTASLLSVGNDLLSATKLSVTGQKSCVEGPREKALPWTVGTGTNS